MLPNVNLNPSFANLAALHNLGNFPHPFHPAPPPNYFHPPMMMNQQPMGVQPAPGMPQHMMMPQANLNNLQALMHVLGIRHA